MTKTKQWVKNPMSEGLKKLIETNAEFREKYYAHKFRKERAAMEMMDKLSDYSQLLCNRHKITGLGGKGFELYLFVTKLGQILDSCPQCEVEKED